MGGRLIYEAKPVTKQAFYSVMETLKQLIPLKLYPIGSAGKKEISSDIDILLDASDLMSWTHTKNITDAKKALQRIFDQYKYPNLKSGVSVNVGIPYDDGQVQVDIMIVDNAEIAVPLHTHDYSQDSNMHGGTLHALWADLANLSSNAFVSYMMSPYKGLVNRNTKEVLSSNKDRIAKIIIGPNATENDMRSLTSMFQALKQYPEKLVQVKDKYFSNF